MTPEEFWKLLGEPDTPLKGSARLKLIRKRYDDYVKAYQTTTLLGIYYLHLYRAARHAYRLALKQRDAGEPMIIVSEFEA